MNDGAFDDPLDYGEEEVLGHSQTVILSHLDGDELSVPDTIEDRLRRGREDAWMQAKAECCMPQIGFRGWQRDDPLNRQWHPDDLPEPPPPRSVDDYGTDDAEPGREPRPTVVALVACVLCLLVIECPLIALRVGGALDWSWGWVLAPVWVPVTVATLAVAVACVWLAAIDEREAAHRRNLLTRGN